MSTGEGPLRVVLFSAAQTAANGTSKWIDVTGYSNLTFYFTTHGNPGAGVVTLEECDYAPTTELPPTGAVSEIDTVDVDVDVGTDHAFAYHASSDRAYHFVRARISTTVTVATLDCVLVANS